LQNTNSVGAQSEGEAERQNSQSGFSSKKVRILTKRHRTNKITWIFNVQVIFIVCLK